MNRCNESPLRGEKPDFQPVSKFNTGSLPVKKNKNHIFAQPASARSTIFSKLCTVIDDVKTIKMVPIIFRSNAKFFLQREIFRIYTLKVSIPYLVKCKCQETTDNLKQMSHLTIYFNLIYYS